MKMVSFILLTLVTVACGPPCNVNVGKTPPTPPAKLEFAFFQQACLSCHTSDNRGITQALKSEATFKAYGPALTRIVNKTMPQGAPFDDATIEKVKQYFAQKEFAHGTD